jgi:myo-inositol catabolism protein IolC
MDINTMTEPDRERLATIEADHRHLLRDMAALTLKMDSVISSIQSLSLAIASQATLRQAQADSTARALGVMGILAALASAAATWWHK